MLSPPYLDCQYVLPRVYCRRASLGAAMAAELFSRLVYNFANRVDDQIGFVDVNMVSTPGGDPLPAVSRQRFGQLGMFLFTPLKLGFPPPGTILVRNAPRKNGQGHVAKRIAMRGALRPQDCRLFSLERIHVGCQMLPTRECPRPHPLRVRRQLVPGWDCSRRLWTRRRRPSSG